MILRPQIALFDDGRLHLQDGPIDLIVGADGGDGEIRAAYQAAARRFAGLLDELCSELPELRKAVDPQRCSLQGVVARRMYRAAAPFAAAAFITPMAAVAGAVAEEVLGVMCEVASLRRAYVNNGGDIALHLDDGAAFAVGLMDRPDRQGVFRTITLRADDAIRGVATSGRHGRSFSLGIADAVTALARTASEADAAVTIIANAVDLPGHPAIIRQRACDIQPESDLVDRLVTREVGMLNDHEIEEALAAGEARAQHLLGAGLIEGAVLQLGGELRIVGTRQLDISRPPLPAAA